jgi:hypothetical protein
VFTTLPYAAAPPVQVWTGVPIFTQFRTLHINGTPVKVRLIEVKYRLMGCKSGCSGGPDLSFWLQIGPDQWNCSRWFSALLAMESLNREGTPYPYLELVTGAPQVWTDEGVWIYPVGEVSCHGALDWERM